MRLYHFTNKTAAREIIKAGAIFTSAWAGADGEPVTPPVVWLTQNPEHAGVDGNPDWYDGGTVRFEVEVQDAHRYSWWLKRVSPDMRRALKQVRQQALALGQDDREYWVVTRPIFKVEWIGTTETENTPPNLGRVK